MLIAECGQNWCNDIGLAKMMIDLAHSNGADLIKFQLFDYEKLYPKHDVPKVELSKEQAFELFNYGKERGAEVFFSVFDVERVKWCEEMGVKRYKIAYSQNNNKQLLNLVAKCNKPIYISVGRADYHVNFYTPIWRLYCISDYPTDLRGIDFYTLGMLEGFSDHTIGLDASKIALARGAEIIEKHFCLDHHTGIDAIWSMDAKELRELKRWETICKEVLL